MTWLSPPGDGTFCEVILMDGQGRRADAGAIIFGLILLFAGGYYLLRNTLGITLPEIDWDMVWPVVIIAIGASILYRAWASRTGSGQRG